tara:strand:- start:1681 stop:1890 length:210 start_codon:yes stop_codon:yes gene_type:complete
MFFEIYVNFIKVCVFLFFMKKVLAIVGIIVTVVHLIYFVLTQYYWVYFFLGFALIYLVFVLPMKSFQKT